MLPLPEVWLRGPVPGINPLLQPVAHALLQAREEVNALMRDFPDDRLWHRPGGVASVGFHLQHLAGVMDRLCTYARDEQLTPQQLDALRAEGQPVESSVAELIAAIDSQVNRTLAQLALTDERTLTEPRVVGRDRLPSTVLGLLVHAAEHVQRHVGQLLVTARVTNQH